MCAPCRRGESSPALIRRALADPAQLVNPLLMDVLYAAADGEKPAETADRLGVIPNVVHQRRFHLVDVLGARDITHAVALAYHTGLLIPRVRRR
jgi:DNA-binding NarL/FixJ family response regulator